VEVDRGDAAVIFGDAGAGGHFHEQGAPLFGKGQQHHPGWTGDRVCEQASLGGQRPRDRPVVHGHRDEVAVASPPAARDHHVIDEEQTSVDLAAALGQVDGPPLGAGDSVEALQERVLVEVRATDAGAMICRAPSGSRRSLRERGPVVVGEQLAGREARQQDEDRRHEADEAEAREHHEELVYEREAHAAAG